MNNYYSCSIGVKSRHCFRKQKLNDSLRLNWSNSELDMELIMLL